MIGRGRGDREGFGRIVLAFASMVPERELRGSEVPGLGGRVWGWCIGRPGSVPACLGRLAGLALGIGM